MEKTTDTEAGPWYAVGLHETLAHWQSDANEGLSTQEAERRLQQYGENVLSEARKKSWVVALLRHFTDFIVLVLFAAVAISFLLGEWLDALAILAIILINAAIGYIQEYRAEEELAALRKLSSPMAEVIRDGMPQHMPSKYLVPGDVVVIDAGDSIPADARLIYSAILKVSEASLTGESSPVTKNAESVLDKDTPLAERRNMIYGGCSVSYGKGKAVVTATGMDTELGKIASLVQSVKEGPTPLQRSLAQVGKLLGILFLIISSVVFALGILRGEPVLTMLLTSLSLAVAAIPEGLPAVVTISLTLGVRRMVRRNVLIRRLSAVETLGSITQICTDKTGTLTEGKMMVTRLYVYDHHVSVSGTGYQPTGQFTIEGKPIQAAEDMAILQALRIAVLCNDAHLVQNSEWIISGDPTEAALLVAAAKAGLWKDSLEWQFPLVFEIPFSSERKRMSSIRTGENGSRTTYVKGAPDTIIELCSHLQVDGRTRPLEENDRAHITRINESMAGEALRVLAVAYRELGDQEDLEGSEKHLTFVGLLGMIDPPRPEVQQALDRCRSAKVGVTMITGDHELTAVAIARDLGILDSESLSMTGREVEQTGDDKLRDSVEQIRVYARATAEDKLRIIRAWKAKGHIVAMTGDGVNDAVALKESDIGIAMGITGTDVSKEASDMVLTDDNFASIVAAVEEGRVIYANIRKFICYLLSCNSAEVLTMVSAFLFGLPLPLIPLQILWINLVTDGLPALALGTDPAEPGLMDRPPRNPRERILNPRIGLFLGLQGSLMAAITLFAFSVTLENTGDLATARTVAFGTLAFTQLFHALNWRSMTNSILQVGILSNRLLLVGIVISGGIQLGALYLPFLQEVFDTVSLDSNTFLTMIAYSSLPLLVMEIAKLFWRTFLRSTRP